jgi:hypothetical protein
MLKFVPVLLSVLFVSPLAFAEVFQCVGKYGEALYQNFPCEFESRREMPTDVPDTKKSLTDVADIKKSPTNVAGQKKPPAAPAEPRIGMTTEEVRAVWGEPTDSLWEEPGDGDRSEIWSYGGSRSVRFDSKRRVAAIQQ